MFRSYDYLSLTNSQMPPYVSSTARRHSFRTCPSFITGMASGVGFNFYARHIIFPEELRRRSYLAHGRHRYMAQIWNLFEIFPSHIKRFTAAIVKQDQTALPNEIKCGSTYSPNISGFTDTVSCACSVSHISLVLTLPAKSSDPADLLCSPDRLFQDTCHRYLVTVVLFFQPVKSFHDSISHKLHHTVYPFRFRHKVTHKVFHAAQFYKLVQKRIIPVPLHGKSAV